jgi:MFS family permease
MRFVVGFGLVSALADIVYEGARSVYGPFLAVLGASALVVSVVTGGGEALALVARLLFGRLADARARRWALAIAGYGLTVIAVPLLGIAQAVGIAIVLLLLERLGKAVRSPSKDAMLAQAGTVTGRGWAFAVHEAIDQAGAFAGPLLIALALAITGSFSPGFLLLAIPGAAAMGVLLLLRRRVPDPSIYEPDSREDSSPTGPQASPPGKVPLPRSFWVYAAFTGLTTSGFATFGLLSFHLVELGTVAIAVIPVIYAVVMAVDAVSALVAGRWYDRIGVQGLVIVPIGTALIPWLGFATTTWLVIAGMLLWGAVLGVQESTLRAAVADLVPDSRRGSAYGIFTAVFGLAWLAGSAVIGLLYEQSTLWAAGFVTLMQVIALVVFVRWRAHLPTGSGGGNATR